MVEELRAALREVIDGKAEAIKPTKELFKNYLSRGYFELRKTMSAEDVLSISEMNKILDSWGGSDAEKAYLQYYYNQIGNPSSQLLENYDYVFTKLTTNDMSHFKRLVGVLIGAGMLGTDMDDFESWLEEDEIKVGDGYRIETPKKSLFGFVHMLSSEPKMWNVSFFGSKQMVSSVRDCLPKSSHIDS